MCSNALALFKFKIRRDLYISFNSLLIHFLTIVNSYCLRPMASTGSAAYAPGGMAYGAGDHLWRTFSGQSVSRRPTKPSEPASEDGYSSDDTVDTPIKGKADNWKLMPDLKGWHDKQEQEHFKGRRLGITWKDLTVKGISSDAALHENVLSQFNLPQIIREKRRGAPKKTILDNVHGCVKPGEMLLVLGRPGSGCTTLLKMLSNHRDGYAEVTGDVHYGSMSHVEAQQYRGQIVMNTEDELFFPTLTVGQTADFAIRTKVPNQRASDTNNPEDYQRKMKHFLLESMGIAHTNDTKVGNEFVRGVSGGERKRVSIIEVLATRGSVYAWDNSTRGLDASTALEYTKAIRALTDILGLASIVTLYQAGNGIYDLFDKVLVLDEGKELYYGPMQQAKPFMEQLGFICADGANVGDFLTGVMVAFTQIVSLSCVLTLRRCPRNGKSTRNLSRPIREVQTTFVQPMKSLPYMST